MNRCITADNVALLPILRLLLPLLMLMHIIQINELCWNNKNSKNVDKSTIMLNNDEERKRRK